MRRVFVFVMLASLGFAAGCGGGKTSTTAAISPTTPSSSSGSNVLTISVDGGPTASQPGGSLYVDAAFASATICSPGSTSNCVTVNNLLVDTGSTGLRVFQSEVASLGLSTVNASNGSPAYDCVNFVDGSYLWGPVQEADVKLGGETAAKLPIQVISSSTTGIPSSCSNGSTLNENSQALLGANGILGVGLEPTDCFYAGGSVCDPNSGLANPPSPAYYTCSGANCKPAFIIAANQVANPVALFPTNNNGVIVELPAVSGNAATVSGSLVFGIGTESNNQLPGSATVFTLACDEFTTIFDSQSFGITNAMTCAGPGSFIDSGSNGLYFPNVTNIPVCSKNTPVGDLSSFYCPASTESFTATDEGEDGSKEANKFSVENAEAVFTNAATASDAALDGLAGANPTGVGFDWGLPFFFGVKVYNAIDGQTVPSGLPAGPWWAY